MYGSIDYDHCIWCETLLEKDEEVTCHKCRDEASPYFNLKPIPPRIKVPSHVKQKDEGDVAYRILVD